MRTGRGGRIKEEDGGGGRKEEERRRGKEGGRRRRRRRRRGKYSDHGVQIIVIHDGRVVFEVFPHSENRSRRLLSKHSSWKRGKKDENGKEEGEKERAIP